MIHFLTVHFKDPAWIKIQTDFIKKFAGPEFLIHTVLVDISEEYHQYFDRVYDSVFSSHADNLNFMAAQVLQQFGNKEDVLVFIDGDAFPIAPIQKYVDLLAGGEKLIAIQRLENNGDIQPHPCFTLITIGFWQEIEGDWSDGYRWLDAQGDRVTDVGGKMLGKLMERKTDWVKLLRSNKKELHELFFGVYDDTVYHHGAGFRRVFGGRVSAVKAGVKEKRKTLLARIFTKYVPEKAEWWLFDLGLHPLSKIYTKLEKEFNPLSKKVYQEIVADPDYVYTFIEEN